MAITSAVESALQQVLESGSVQQKQERAAAYIISQFLRVREGLEPHVSKDALDETAARLTAGIWANPD